MTDTTSPAGLDELLKALRGGEDPSVTPPPGLMMPGQPVAPGAPPPQAAQPAPPPTDDPGLAMPAIPKPPDLSNSPLAQLLTKTNQDQAAIAAVPKPDPAQLGPRLWERILGGVLGATQLKNPENAGAVADPVVHRRLYGAQRDYDVKTSPLYKQLETDRQGLPVAEAQAKIPQQDYENKLQGVREQREQIATKSLAQHRNEIEDIKRDIANNNLEVAQGKIKQAQEALEQRGKFQSDTLDLKRQLGELNAQIRERGLADREKAVKDKSDPNGFSASEEREIKDKSRRYQTRVDSLEKQRVDYMGSKNTDDAATLAAIDKEIEDNHQKIDQVQQDVIGRRSTSGKPAASGNGAASPSAAAPSGKVFNVAKWQAANPKGDVSAARAQAKQQGFKIKEQ